MFSDLQIDLGPSVRVLFRRFYTTLRAAENRRKGSNIRNRVYFTSTTMFSLAETLSNSV